MFFIPFKAKAFYTPFFGILAFTLLLSGCTSSLIYSPTAGIPDRPLGNGEVFVSGGAELLPETRPYTFNRTGDYTAIGATIQVGYGFSSRFSLIARGSGDVEGKLSSYRSSFSLTGLYHWSRGVRSRWYWLNRVGTSLSNQTLEGSGVQTMALWQYDYSKRLSFTAGPSLIWGFRSFAKEPNSRGENLFPMGWGIGLHSAAAYRLSDQLTFQVEVAPIGQFDRFDNRNYWLFAPMASLSYRFNSSKKK